MEQLHMRRLVWRWGRGEGKWLTSGLEKMHFGDRPAACGLEVGKHMVADLGKTINPKASEMIKKGYVDDIIAGGDEATVDRLVGTETWKEGKPSYDGTIPQIISLGSATKLVCNYIPKYSI